MARPLRVEFPNATYHVTARGNERKPIFRDDHDRHRFLDTLAEMVERFGIRLHAYCLMPNHYHLVLETPRANLSQAVGWLQVTYTVRFNHRHRRSGHLFQGRFKAQLVEADAYARWLIEYIHLNPVRPTRKGQPIPADRAADLDAFDWSSHRDYAGLRPKSPPWLCLDWLRYWGTDPDAARAEYRRAMGKAFGQPVVNPWQNLLAGFVLGSRELLAKATALAGGQPAQNTANWTRRQQLEQRRARLEQLLVTESDDRIKIWARVKLGGERGVDVARAFGYQNGSGVGQVIRRLETEMADNEELRTKLNQLKTSLSSVES